MMKFRALLRKTHIFGGKSDDFFQTAATQGALPASAAVFAHDVFREKPGSRISLKRSAPSNRCAPSAFS
jgi:hypothetical protein